MLAVIQAAPESVSYWNLAFNAVTIIVLIGGAIFTARRMGGVNAGQEWRQEAEAIRNRADRLHDELDDALLANREMQAQLSNLEALPDMTALLQEMKAQREWSERNTSEAMGTVTQMFSNHEERAQERHKLIVESFSQLNTGLLEINKSLRALNGGRS